MSAAVRLDRRRPLRELTGTAGAALRLADWRLLAAPWPGLPHSALASTRATITSDTIQKSVPLLGTAGGLWLAEPMNKSRGMESTTFVRDASPPRAPAGALSRSRPNRAVRAAFRPSRR